MAKPVQCPLIVDLNQGRLLAGVIGAHNLDKSPVAGFAGIGGHHTVRGLLLLAHPHQPESYCHKSVSPSVFLGPLGVLSPIVPSSVPVKARTGADRRNGKTLPAENLYGLPQGGEIEFPVFQAR